jgi:hypothetical protein
MTKKIFVFIVTIVVFIIFIIAGLYIFQSKNEKYKAIEKASSDAKNCTYIINGENVAIKDGYSEEGIAPDSFSKVVTRYFGNEAPYDFNGDGLPDIAFILTQNMGGSGTYYYVAVALSGINGCKGTNAVFLGDRIGLQNTEIQNGKIIVNYTDRRIDEPMVAHPSIGITKQFALEGVTLKDVTSEETKKEQSCLIYGGKITTSSCCAAASDFPNICLVGTCGCSSTDSHQIKTCDCGEGKCFNGSECVAD